MQTPTLTVTVEKELKLMQSNSACAHQNFRVRGGFFVITKLQFNGSP